MKIFLANKLFYLKGGAEASFFETAKLLVDKGHKAILFSMEHPRNFSSEYEKSFVSKLDYEKKRLWSKFGVSLKLIYKVAIGCG